MKLLPPSVERSFEAGPKLTLGSMSIVLSSLMRIAHPHGNAWHFAEGFFSGMAIALVLADFYGRWKTRTRK
jgi:hypothetical protein